MNILLNNFALYIIGINEFIASFKEKISGVKQSAASSPIYEIALYSFGAIIIFIVMIIVVFILVMLLRRD